MRRRVVEGFPHESTVVVAIPARDEVDRIADALAHSSKAAEQTAEAVACVVVVNDSSDRTFEVALDALSDSSFDGWDLLDITFGDAISHIGAARRVTLDLAADLPASRYLLSTDADSRVSPNWIRAMADNLQCHELVCGRLGVDREELAQLPTSVDRCGRAEAQLEAGNVRLWQSIRGDTWPDFINKASGANMGFRAETYKMVGRLPIISHSEDRALLRRILTLGGSIGHAQDAVVTTSCRTDSRARGGMGDCIRRRAENRDPAVDAQLMRARDVLAMALGHAANASEVRWHSGVVKRSTPLTLHDAIREAGLCHDVARAIEAGQDGHDLLRKMDGKQVLKETSSGSVAVPI